MEKMGTHGWRSDYPLRDQLFDTGYQFGFYQAVRLLEKVNPNQTPVGEGSAPEKEPVRFTSNVSHDFPASEISDIFPGESGRDMCTMAVNFMGLAGSHGPMPAPYTELILERTRRKDTALKDFLDIFNHRLISLMYRIRKTHRPGFDLSHPSKSHFAWYFLSLIGLGSEGLRHRMAVGDRALLHYTALLSQQPRSMCGLETLLSDYFKVPVKGGHYAGQWFRLDTDQLTRIGQSGQNQILGNSAILAYRVWDQQNKFQLHFPSLGLKDLLSFLPPGEAYRPLCQMTTFYTGTEFDFEFLLNLPANQVPRARLGAENGARLGWTSWVRAQETQKEQGNVRLVPRLVTRLKNDFGFDYERKFA